MVGGQIIVQSVHLRGEIGADRSRLIRSLAAGQRLVLGVQLQPHLEVVADLRERSMAGSMLGGNLSVRVVFSIEAVLKRFYLY